MAINSALVYYVIPALLGRAFDMRSNSVGPDLFTAQEVEKAWTIDKYETTCEYKLVSDAREAKDFLDVDGQLSLAISNGKIKAEGIGKYLNDVSTMEKRLDVVIKCHHTTICKMIPSESKPMSEWPTMVKDSNMTHYVRSICYGGELIACIKYSCKKEEDKEMIKGVVQGEISSSSGSFGGGLKGGLEMVKEKIGEAASMEINYYATVPLGEEIPSSLEGLIKVVDEFPEAAKAINDGYGVPVNMEVFSLEGLDKNARTYYQTLALQDQLALVDEQLADIRQAKQRLADWLQTMPPDLPREEDDKIEKFANTLEKINRVFNELLGNLNLSAEANADQFQPVFDAYLGDHDVIIPDMYVKDLSKLKKDVLDNTPSLEGDYGGSHYTYWGSDTCPTDTSLIFAGVLSTTDHGSIGASEYTCFPNDRQYPNDKPTGDVEIDDYPRLQQVAFVSRKKGSDQKQKTIKCASCRVPGKSTTTVLTAQNKCPDGWTKQYEGTLISTDYQQVRGEMICADLSQSLKDVPSDAEDLTVLTELSPKCGSYPCSGGVSEVTSLPCVVCSITKKSTSAADFLVL